MIWRILSLSLLFASLTSYAQSQIAFRFNWTPRTALADCGNVQTGVPEAKLAVSVNGVQQTVTENPTTGGSFLSTFNAANGDVVTAFLTLPSGRVRVYDDVAGDPSILSFATNSVFITYVNDPSVDSQENACTRVSDVDYAGGAQ